MATRKKQTLKPITPRSKIESKLRRIWEWSRERRNALKLAENKCQQCGAEAYHEKKNPDGAKLHVHHVEGAYLKEIVGDIKEKLLCSEHPEKLEVLCQKCHATRHPEGMLRIKTDDEEI